MEYAAADVEEEAKRIAAKIAGRERREEASIRAAVRAADREVHEQRNNERANAATGQQTQRELSFSSDEDESSSDDEPFLERIGALPRESRSIRASVRRVERRARKRQREEEAADDAPRPTRASVAGTSRPPPGLLVPPAVRDYIRSLEREREELESEISRLKLDRRLARARALERIKPLLREREARWHAAVVERRAFARCAAAVPSRFDLPPFEHAPPTRESFEAMLKLAAEGSEEGDCKTNLIYFE